MQKMGRLPIVRREEVLFNHYRLLKVIDQVTDAQHYLQLAYSIVQEKARSITNLDYRRSFLELVPISRTIVSSYEMEFPTRLSDQG